MCPPLPLLARSSRDASIGSSSSGSSERWNASGTPSRPEWPAATPLSSDREEPTYLVRCYRAMNRALRSGALVAVLGLLLARSLISLVGPDTSVVAVGRSPTSGHHPPCAANPDTNRPLRRNGHTHHPWPNNSFGPAASDRGLARGMA